MIELRQTPAAGRLGSKGVRSWIEFTIGSPRQPTGAKFFLFGPWGDGRYGALGHHSRYGWVLRWQAKGEFYEVEVSTFADIMRIAKLGPVEAAAATEQALAQASRATGATFLRLGHNT